MEEQKTKDLSNVTGKIVRKLKKETQNQEEVTKVLQAAVSLLLGPEWRVVSMKENQN